MAEPIHITRSLFIDPSEIEEAFVRASGPGGQNVNKVSSAVQLRFDLWANTSLPDAMKRRAADMAGSRLTKNGVIVITANSHRDQPLNRTEALEKLVALLRAAAYPAQTTHCDSTDTCLKEAPIGWQIGAIGGQAHACKTKDAE